MSRTHTRAATKRRDQCRTLLDKNRSHSKISRLPSDVKMQINELIIQGKTYKQISDHLKSLNHDISPAAVGRDAQLKAKTFEAINLSKAFAQQIAENNADRPSTELHEVNNLVVSEIIMKMIIDDQNDLADKLKAARTIAFLQQAQVSNESLKIKSRKELGPVKVAMEQLKQRVIEILGEQYPDIAEQLIQIANDTEKSLHVQK